jgi:hypothetical protein
VKQGVGSVSALLIAFSHFSFLFKSLDRVAHSNFKSLPGDSFHLMQQDWKLEIADRLTEIRVKENVSLYRSMVLSSVSDPHRFYADPDLDPDPAFLLNADPDPRFSNGSKFLV